MMKQTIYLVDSENVNDAWVNLLPKLNHRDKVIVFHTRNSPHFTTESAAAMADFKKDTLTWEKCFTGTNGLDFQLVSRLGYLICKRPRAVFVIVSNDTGFDAAIKYWVQEGVQVSRIRGASCSEDAPLTEVQEKIVLEDAPDKSKRKPRKKKKKYKDTEGTYQNRNDQPREQTEKTDQPQGNGKYQAAGSRPAEDKKDGKPQADSQPKPEKKPMEKTDQPQAQKAQPPKEREEKKIPVASVLGLCRSISLSRYSLIHEALVALLGAQDGREVYCFLKENQEFQEKLRKIYLPEKNARVENYLRVVFEYHKVPLTDMAAVRRVIDKNQSGDKNTIYRSFTEAFGQKKGALYYGILKPHIRVIKRL